LRQEDLEFKDSLGYIVRSYLKKKKITGCQEGQMVHPYRTGSSMDLRCGEPETMKGQVAGVCECTQDFF
jgi:hypothetical protein